MDEVWVFTGDICPPFAFDKIIADEKFDVACKCSVIAPDNLGSGYSEHRDPTVTAYTFDFLDDHVKGLIDALDVKRDVI